MSHDTFSALAQITATLFVAWVLQEIALFRVRPTQRQKNGKPIIRQTFVAAMVFIPLLFIVEVMCLIGMNIPEETGDNTNLTTFTILFAGLLGAWWMLTFIDGVMAAARGEFRRADDLPS